MRWKEYYDKVNDWETSTAVRRLSSLENIGPAGEVAEVITLIGFDDEKGATRLLQKAIEAGVVFTGENLVDIAGSCDEDVFKRALYVSASKFTAQDLENLYGMIDDEDVAEIARKFDLPVSDSIADEYEEILCKDTSEPISWEKFYDKLYYWSEEFAKARLTALTSFGDENEVMEVINELLSDNEYEASKFVRRAIEYGVKFGEDNLLEISSLCDNETTNAAVIASGTLLNENSLEELYGEIDDEAIIEVAKRQKLELPEELREEESEESEDISWQINSAIDAANYAIECLVNARDSFDESSNISVLDMLSGRFFPSLMKYESLQYAENELNVARDAIDNFNYELRELKQNKEIHLSSVKLYSVIDMWFDNKYTDCLVHSQIGKTQKRINKAILQIEKIKKELIVAQR